MKLSGRRIEPFLARPDAAVRAVLIYGPNAGLVRERAERLVRSVIDDPKDPFRLSDLTGAALKSDPARLGDEAAALSLSGGRRVVRVREAGDVQSGAFHHYFKQKQGDALVVVESGDLGPRSSLRRLFESADDAASLPCYGDEGPGLEELIRETLKRDGLTIEPAALAYLVDFLGNDRVLIRGELEKLAIYVGAGAKGGGREIGFADAVACVGDSVALSLEEIGSAAAEGDSERLERALGRAFGEGVPPVTVLRAVTRYLGRLHLVSGRIAGGETEEGAIAGLRPPLFFKAKPAFQRQLKLWDLGRLAEALEILTRAEIECKTTGYPARSICGRALMRVAAGAEPPGRGA